MVGKHLYAAKSPTGVRGILDAYSDDPVVCRHFAEVLDQLAEAVCPAPAAAEYIARLERNFQYLDDQI